MTGNGEVRQVSWRRRLLGRQDANLWFWVFVGPFFAGLVLFIYVPIAWSAYLSFFEAYNTVTPTRWVGLSGVRSCGCRPSIALSAAMRASYCPSLIVGASLTW